MEDATLLLCLVGNAVCFFTFTRKLYYRTVLTSVLNVSLFSLALTIFAGIVHGILLHTEIIVDTERREYLINQLPFQETNLKFCCNFLLSQCTI
jgi:predicted Kef-type K+ transport protein